MIFVALVGKSNSGKSTAATVVAEMLGEEGCEAYQWAFADPIKNIVREAFNLNWYDVNTQDGKASTYPTTYGLTSRELLQKVGTDLFRRGLKDTLWVDNLVTRCGIAEEQYVREILAPQDDSPPPPMPVNIITDMRELVEYEGLSGHDLFTIYLTRDVKSSASNGHSSEALFEAPFDIVIDNQTSSPEVFESQIREVVPQILSWLGERNARY